MTAHRLIAHGTRAGYQSGCPCHACRVDGRTSNRNYQRDYRAGHRGSRHRPMAWDAPAGIQLALLED